MLIAQLFLNLHNYRSQIDFSESSKQLDAIALLFPLNFNETGDQIKSILEKRYTDGISGFESVKVEGNKITGIFYDIVSPALTKKFNFTIDADQGDVDYTQVDTGKNLEQSFSEYSFATPAKKSKQCKEGKSSACTRGDGSVYCIKVGYKCKSVGLSGEEKAVAQAIVEKDKSKDSIPKAQKEKITTQIDKKIVNKDLPDSPLILDTKTKEANNTKSVSVDDKKEVSELYKQWTKSPAFKTLKQFQQLNTAKEGVEFSKSKIEEVRKSNREEYSIVNFKSGSPQAQKFSKQEYLQFLEKKINSDVNKVKKIEQDLGGVELSVDAERLGAALIIYEEIGKSLKDKKMLAGGVKGENGNLSSMYLYNKKDDALYLEFLVTAPENLIKGKGQKGSGTAAIENLISKSKEIGTEGKIKLFALEDAIPFYRKIGFTNDDGSNSENMTLSVESANKFTEKRR